MYDTIDQAITAAEAVRETETAFAEFEAFLFDSEKESEAQDEYFTILS